VQLTPSEASNLAATPQPVNREAYDQFLQSRHSSFTGTREGIDLGLRHAKRALEIDPKFALAWSALAECHLLRALRGMAPYVETAAEAIKAAKRALELDPSLAQAHASLGFVEFYTGDLREGVKRIRKAIELNPGDAMAHTILSRSLISLEQHDEALAEAQKATALDPLSVLNQNTIGDAYYFAREYEKAVLAYRITLEIVRRFDGAHADLGRALEALGRFDEARAECIEARRLAGPDIAAPTFALAHVEAAAGNDAEARRLLKELINARETRVVSSYGIATVHASLGDIDEAFRWLDIAVKEGASGLVMLRVHPRLDRIRNDPRYPPLLKKLGLAD
jgi:serine/threonine-protein kinase